MRQRTPIVSFALALIVAACSGSTATIGGEAPPDDAGDPDGGSKGDATSSGGSGTSGSSGTSGASGTSGTSGGNGDGSAGGRVDAKISITQLSEACQPPVANDPVTMIGTLSLSNGTAATIGPGAVSGGAFLEQGSGKVVAGYNFEKNGLPAISPGGSAVVNLVKTSGSMNPADGCNVLACGKSYIVEIAVTGTGIPQGTRLRTNPIVVTCTN